VRYLFEDYVLDTDRRELRRGSDVLRVTAQVFDLLAYLIRNRDRVVSKEDLIAAIWDGRIVSDSALTTRLNVVRDAIADTGKEQRLVKTLPRKGFRFVGKVCEENAQADAPASIRTLQTPPAGHFSVRPSIMVLPFANLSGDPKLDVLGEAIPEDVSTALLELREPVLIAWDNRLVANSTNRDVCEIGVERGARYVLEGSVRSAGARTRVSARLIDAIAGVHVWGRHYDLDRAGGPAFHDETVHAIVSAVSAAIRHADLQRARHKRPEQLGAWEAYQRGLWHMSTSEAAENKLARSLFQHAVDLDPNFGPGYAALAFTYTAASSAFSEMSIAESCELAEPLVLKAIALDENDAEARSRLALLALLRGDLEGAAREADLALSINEGCPDAWGVKGAALVYAGRRWDGRNAINQYFALKPRDIARPLRRTQIASSLYLDGGYEEAARTAREVICHYPRHPFAYRWLAASLGQLGKTGEAREVLQTLQTISPSSFEMYIRQRPPQFCSAEYAPMLQGLRKAGWKE
jgi:DNA-binding winged helix-turn-helix (wHTH) protein/Flp pilus assembly protein TadD